MYEPRLLPGEQRLLPGEHTRRPNASVEEADTFRSVRSMLERFEQQPASAPTTPAKKRTSRTRPVRAQTRTQAELAAFLKGGVDAPREPSRRTSGSGPTHNTVGSLIEKWSSANSKRPSADRPPLQERDLQRVDEPVKPLVDSVDTFGSSSADYDRAIPKTDPGRLESYAAQLDREKHAVNAAADIVASGDQSLRDIVARSVHHRASHRPTAVPKQESTESNGPSAPPKSQDNLPVRLSKSLDGHPLPHTQDRAQQQESDWGAGDVYIRVLFAEAEDTAERAVQCDENEEYFEAFELYWVVVDLYYKVIPFLTPEEGGDVHERIKMYTRRCEAIREAFEDDPEGQDEIEVRIADATIASAAKEEQLQESFNNGVWNPQPEMDNIAQQRHSSSSPQETQPVSETLPPTPVAVDEDPVLIQQSFEAELPKHRFPDYNNAKPLAAIPDAPRNPAVSASTAAHRNSLSRPISRSAVRASTSSVSRERVAEMQERVQVMQECLNNFTVKRKHLGPARALELHVTTLNANTFGDLKKLAPLAPELEHKWATELEVLLSMLQEIKEVRPGAGYALREDIARHLPALERCDRSVRKTMRSFGALAGHVHYVERETASNSAKGGRSRRRWWVKVPVVRKGGLPDEIFRIVEEAEKEMRGVFKVCHEINVEVVKSMPVPPSFVEGLPKHARSLIPRELKEGLTTWGMFKVSDYMKDRNLWNKEAAKEITSSLEKVALIWEAKTSNKSFLSRTFDIRGERFHQAMTAFRRCQNAIRDLRREWYVYLS